MSFKVAIIGRPNVGKSTLFNRLVGKRLALVDDQPGITRDRKEAPAQLGPLSFTIVDTAGLEPVNKNSGEIEQKSQQQTTMAAEDADAVLFVIDGRAGLTPKDREYAKWLHKKHKSVVLVANKCEGREAHPGLEESYTLGFGEPVAISAEHGEGLADLYDALAAFAPEELPQEEEGDDTPPETLKITLLGRPNAGKSTLLNRLLGYERAVTSSEAGTTRDAIYTHLEYEGTPLLLVDTAGIRRKAKIADKIEQLSVNDSLKAAQYSHVVVLMVDATHPLEKQDLSLIGHIINEGRGLIIAINKWDLVENPETLKKEIRERLMYDIPIAEHAPLIELSAKEGLGVPQLMRAILNVYKAWNQRIPTGEINRWLEGALAQHTPPLVGGRRLKIRYMTQSKGRPPTFVLFTSNAREFPESYLRYLTNNLRQTYGFAGCPLRLLPRGKDNPFHGEKS